MSASHNYWNELLTKFGQEYIIKNRMEILSIYYVIGAYWNGDLKLKTGDTFTIPKSKYGSIPETTYKVMNTGISKCLNVIKETGNGNIKLSDKHASGLLFEYKGNVTYIFFLL